MEPLHAPRRTTAGPETARNSNGAMLWIAAIALAFLGAIAYQHLFRASPGLSAAAGGTFVPGAEGGVAIEGGSAGEGGATIATSTLRTSIDDAPLQMAPSLPRERFAGPVTHSTDSEVCRELRAERAAVNKAMGKPHSAAQAKGYQLDLRSVSERGTKLGCWSGGAG